MWLLKKLDWWLLSSIAVLCGMSLLMLTSLGARSEEPFFWVWRQAGWIALGALLVFVAASFDYRIFRISSAVTMGFYLVSLAALAAVLAWGETIRGSQGWFALGSFTVQPVELMKIALLLVLAKYFAAKNVEIWQFRRIAASAVWAFVPVALLLFQPDWGSALVVAAVWFLVVLCSGARRKHVVALVILLVAAGIFSWYVALTSAQKARILTLLQPSLDPYGVSYSQRQALIAIGSGGAWGKGVGEGTQTQLRFLPEARTDFMFAAVAEELGFAGVAVAILCYGILFFRLYLVATHSPNNFARFFVLGLLLLLGLHVVMNIGMNLGVLPVVGLTLPFLSYGGSSMLSNFLGAGIVLSMKVRA